MEKLEAGHPDTQSVDIVAANLDRLRELFPDAFTEGRVDFEALRGLLGDAVDTGDEKYGLTWHGKRKARRLALTPSTGTLRPAPEESVDWETTQNLMIEGDNLEVLKLLQKSYAGKVKLIYIDPPYNTGNDFVYRDDFRDNIRNYLELTGQVDTGGKKVSSNTDAGGRFHTTWLNMMYPRLMLARYMLARQGIILISIGDHEIHNLRLICDEIYGEENFCGMFVWEKKRKPSFLSRNMSVVTDYVLAYARDRAASPPFISGVVESGKKYPFNNAGNGITTLRFPHGSVKFNIPDQIVSAQDMSGGNIITELLDDVSIEDGVNANAFRLKGEWRYSQAKLDSMVAAGEGIVVSQVPFRPNYVNLSEDSKKTANLLSYRLTDIPTNEDATAEMRDLFGDDVMSYPKPVGLIQFFVSAITEADDIVMDFFAGSGTTAHAVWAQNQEDGGGRRVLLVQLPEPLDPQLSAQAKAVRFCRDNSLPATIAELTKERLRRARDKINAVLADGPSDLGFRVFKLASSNLKEWDPMPTNLEASLFDSVDHIKPSRNKEDLLYEVCLRLGLELTVPIEQRQIREKTVHAIGRGVLFLCLESAIEESDVEALSSGIAEWQELLSPVVEPVVVFRDSAFSSDVAKVNLSQGLLQRGIGSVRSI